MTSGGGSAGRAAAGAVRIGNAVGAAFTNRRVLEPIEARIMTPAALLLLALAILFATLPALLVYPVLIVLFGSPSRCFTVATSFVAQISSTRTAGLVSE